jgi:hypothetical protein
VELPRRIGIKHRIASVAWERSVLVTGCGQSLNAFGAANLRFPGSDMLCCLKDLALASRYNLLLLSPGQGCNVSRFLDGMEKFERASALDYFGPLDRGMADVQQAGGFLN